LKDNVLLDGQVNATEAKYLVLLLCGELRLGISRHDIEEAASTARRARTSVSR
jgi:hypothetical protein